MTDDAVQQRPPLGSVALLSAAALATEILLSRAFAVVHWHHFAYMIISLALLGFGASGTFLALAHRWLLRCFAAVTRPTSQLTRERGGSIAAARVSHRRAGSPRRRSSSW